LKKETVQGTAENALLGQHQTLDGLTMGKLLRIDKGGRLSYMMWSTLEMSITT